MKLDGQKEPKKVLVGFRPESVLWERPQEDGQEGGQGGFVALEGKAILSEDLGGEEIVYLEAGNKIITMMRFHFEDVAEIPYGAVYTVYIRGKDIICYDAETLARL
jgi:ABC-type sugar transport system ATPase subunit